MLLRRKVKNRKGFVRMDEKREQKTERILKAEGCSIYHIK